MKQSTAEQLVPESVWSTHNRDILRLLPHEEQKFKQNINTIEESEQKPHFFLQNAGDRSIKSYFCKIICDSGIYKRRNNHNSFHKWQLGFYVNFVSMFN